MYKSNFLFKMIRLNWFDTSNIIFDSSDSCWPRLFRVADVCFKNRENIGKMGFYMPFEAFESRFLMHFEPFRGSASGVQFVLRWCILLIYSFLDELWLASIPVIPIPVIFLGMFNSSLLYITIYILVSYIIYKEVLYSQLIGIGIIGITETL